MTDFYSFLTHVINKPGIYNVNKIEDIDYIILGYSVARAGDSSDKKLAFFLDAFSVYICKRYKSEHSVNWCRLIRFYSGSDSHSLELFKENINDFFENNR